jgi:hypothetical protein
MKVVIYQSYCTILPTGPIPLNTTITVTNHKAKHKHELELLQDLWHLFKERRVLGFFARRTPRHVDTEHVSRDRLQNMHGDAAEEAVLNASQKLPTVTSHQTHFSKLRESGRTASLWIRNWLPLHSSYAVSPLILI